MAGASLDDALHKATTTRKRDALRLPLPFKTIYNPACAFWL